ncbi:hypothetical protein BS78_02G013300 [Paspalum vaginatum]|nr:hypothetical protein BS78_02G013300 [Paspalum vaginatum]
MFTEMLGSAFDYVALPSVGLSGGILVAWRRDIWSVTTVVTRTWSITAKVGLLSSESLNWWLTVVYGPCSDASKRDFLQELCDVRSSRPGPWLVGGDFNMIYMAADKNSGRLNRRVMRWFSSFLNDAGLSELHLNGRLFTWSNERDHPTLERIDRVFASPDWLDALPNHWLRALSSDFSDHSPLLLQTCCVPWAKRRFKFESIWPKFQGFTEAVREAWETPVQNSDPCRVLDYKLRNTAKSLKKWSSKHVGSIRLQLAMARELVFRFDTAQERRDLSPRELQFRNQLKLKCLGLSSLARTIARQRSRLIFLEAGDANTKLFHLQACHRSRKNFIADLHVDGRTVSEPNLMSSELFAHFNEVLGKEYSRLHGINLQRLNLPEVDLEGLDYCFSEEEIWNVIRELPSEKAPGPDGFTGLFYRVAWPIIKGDVINAFNAFWSLDHRSLFLINDALLVC